MRLTIDTTERLLHCEGRGESRTLPLYSAEAFQLLSREWVRVGWALKYSYSFTWFGVPIIQLPEDVVRIQETIYSLQPDVIVETGVAHGGSLIFYASLCKALGKGRVIGIDIEIRPHNRKVIESHPLADAITLIEGSSVDPAVVAKVRGLVRDGEKVLVLLDSNHSKSHVAAELNAYADLVTPGSYIIATDGIMQDLTDVPGGRPEWSQDNPQQAALEFAAKHPEFKLEDPPLLFNEGKVAGRITYWPTAYLRRVR